MIESSSEEEESGEAGDETVKELRSKRERLRKLQEEKQRHQQSVEKVLRSGARPMQLEITPVFLVPDTNCFIDHLHPIQTLLSSKRFTLIVPLVGESLGLD